MKVFPFLFLLTFGVAYGALNRTTSLLDLTRQTLDFIPSLRNIARSEEGGKETLAETAVKRITDIFANFRPRERLNILRPPEGAEGGSLMRRIADTLEPMLNPLRNLTAHVAGNKSISALFPKKTT